MRYSYTKALEIVKEWAIKEGYSDISFDYDDVSFVQWENKTLNSPKKIRINKKHPVELKVYVLLHELGHHQLRKNWGEFSRRMPEMAFAEVVKLNEKETKYMRRVTYTVGCMEEEFKAWEEGYKLGIRLGIRINLEKWGRFKAKCLISYMRYYATK